MVILMGILTRRTDGKIFFHCFIYVKTQRAFIEESFKSISANVWVL